MISSIVLFLKRDCADGAGPAVGFPSTLDPGAPDVAGAAVVVPVPDVVGPEVVLVPGPKGPDAVAVPGRVVEEVGAWKPPEVPGADSGGKRLGPELGAELDGFGADVLGLKVENGALGADDAGALVVVLKRVEEGCEAAVVPAGWLPEVAGVPKLNVGLDGGGAPGGDDMLGKFDALDEVDGAFPNGLGADCPV